MVLYHNRAATTSVPDQEAYELGKKGFLVSAAYLVQYMRRHNEVSYEVREQQLNRKVSGFGVRLHHSIAILAGFTIFVMALFVDYHIVKEFWTWALSNEDGELQAVLRDSVVFKSLQVVFATMAIHFVLTNIGGPGRTLFAIFIFILTVGMITGVGLLWATNSLPPGAKLFGVDVHGSAESVSQTLESMGLKPVTPQTDGQAAGGVISADAIKTYQTVIWLGALSVLFLIVASVGAMALEGAIRGFTGLTGGAIYDTNRAVAARSHALRDDLDRVRVERTRVNSSEFWRHKIADFVTSYTSGVLSQRFSTSRTQELLDSVTVAAKEAETELANG